MTLKYATSGSETPLEEPSPPAPAQTNSKLLEPDDLDIIGPEEQQRTALGAPMDAEAQLLQEDRSLATCRFFSASPLVPVAAFSEGELDLLSDSQPPRPSSTQRLSHTYSLRKDGAPLVSVITALPLRSNWAQDTEASMHMQTLQQWEWLLVSPQDSSPPSISDTRVRVLHSASATAPRAQLLNTALDQARTAFVFILDPGDGHIFDFDILSALIRLT